MTLYLVANDKGGVGKSCIAPHLAVYLYDLGNSVALIDADRQLHAAKHIHSAEPSIPVGALFDVAQIKETVPKLKAKHDFIVADAPANLGNETRALMTLADVVILPTEASLKALESTVSTFRLIQDARSVSGSDTNAWVVFNKIDERRKRHNLKYRQDAVNKGLPVTNAYVRYHSIINDADEMKTVVSRMQSNERSKSALADLTAVFAEVFNHQLKKVANA